MSTKATSSSEITSNYHAIVERVSRIGGNRRVTVVAVSKTQASSAIELAYRGGVCDFGENYGSELAKKAKELSGLPITWHMIGALQSKNILQIAPFVSLWHSISRRKELDILGQITPAPDALIQVNYSDEPGRNGVLASEVEDLVKYGLDLRINMVGLMVVTPVVPVADRVKIFRDTYRLGSSLGLSEFSMGMSDDFESAVQEGSTIVRVGRAVFGKRAQKADQS